MDSDFEEIEMILNEYNILKQTFKPIDFYLLGQDKEEIAKSDKLITKIRALISRLAGKESEYYNALEQEEKKRGRNYLYLCISTLEAFYENYKRDSKVSKVKKAENSKNKKSVFVVHGRNEELRKSIFLFLRSIGLDPIEWAAAVKMTGKPNPHIDDILVATFKNAQAILVLLTPDDLAKLKPELQKDDDPQYEKELTGQARPNVLFEAGMAYGRDPDRTVLVQIGTLRPFSDISGRHLLHLNNTPQAQKKIADRLELAGCEIDLKGTDWLNTGDFNLI